MTRVEIQNCTLEHMAEITAASLASTQMHYPWVQAPTTETAYRGYMERILQGRTIGLYARTIGDHRPVGVINLSEPVMGAFCSAFLGYYGFAETQGRGLMTEAMALSIDHAFRRLGLHRLEANVQPGNERSLALVRRLGLRQEGFSPKYLKVGGDWRDHERWAILAEDWTMPAGLC